MEYAPHLLAGLGGMTFALMWSKIRQNSESIDRLHRTTEFFMSQVQAMTKIFFLVVKKKTHNIHGHVVVEGDLGSDSDDEDDEDTRHIYAQTPTNPTNPTTLGGQMWSYADGFGDSFNGMDGMDGMEVFTSPSTPDTPPIPSNSDTSGVSLEEAHCSDWSSDEDEAGELW